MLQPLRFGDIRLGQKKRAPVQSPSVRQCHIDSKEVNPMTGRNDVLKIFIAI